MKNARGTLKGDYLKTLVAALAFSMNEALIHFSRCYLCATWRFFLSPKPPENRGILWWALKDSNLRPSD